MGSIYTQKYPLIHTPEHRHRGTSEESCQRTQRYYALSRAGINLLGEGSATEPLLPPSITPHKIALQVNICGICNSPLIVNCLSCFHYLAFMFWPESGLCVLVGREISLGIQHRACFLQLCSALLLKSSVLRLFQSPTWCNWTKTAMCLSCSCLLLSHEKWLLCVYTWCFWLFHYAFGGVLSMKRISVSFIYYISTEGSCYNCVYCHCYRITFWLELW